MPELRIAITGTTATPSASAGSGITPSGLRAQELEQHGIQQGGFFDRRRVPGTRNDVERRARYAIVNHLRPFRAVRAVVLASGDEGWALDIRQLHASRACR